MSFTYEPDQGAIPDASQKTIFLSQRDLSLQIPVDFVTQPAVGVGSACFAHQRYLAADLAKCLSNLLAVGFRRFELDIYWDESRSIWSFCPVTIPEGTSGSVSLPQPSSAMSSLSSSSDASVVTSSALSSALAERQADASISGVSLSTTNSENASTTQATASVTPTVLSFPNTGNETLVAIGPYTCSTSITLSTFTSVLLAYIQFTENTIDAHLHYLVLNVHAAASATSPNLPAPPVTNIPTPSNFLGNLFSGNFSAYLYTLKNLESDRANLNSSFFTVPERYRPAILYDTSTDANGILSTKDGWPAESFVELQNSKRLFVEWGSFDAQLGAYNVATDSGIFFPNTYIESNQSVLVTNSSGGVIQGCLVSNKTFDLSSLNASWATSTIQPGTDNVYALASNMARCGISPMLNVTLDATAGQSYEPYRNFTYSTVWSWDVSAGEPKNYSSELYRCTTTQQGRWYVSDCSQKYFAACRSTSEPLAWKISSYQDAVGACDDGYEFAVPRTALENGCLTRAMNLANQEYDGNAVLVDFNSLNINYCWVVGANNTCPYSNIDPMAEERTILVPAIAVVIVLVVTALTVFSKAAGNRKVRKRTKRRAINGFVYEGVPS